MPKEINTVFKIAQSVNTDINVVATSIEKLLESLKQTRNSYLKIKSEAEKIANQWNIPAQFTKKRQPKVKNISKTCAKIGVLTMRIGGSKSPYFIVQSILSQHSSHSVLLRYNTSTIILAFFNSKCFLSCL